jgi:hypothetical protein
MLNDLGDHSFSRANLVRSLLGDGGGEGRPLSARLKRSFWFGRLSLLGKARIDAVLDGLVNRGWAETVTLAYEGHEYTTVRITDEGRKHA